MVFEKNYNVQIYPSRTRVAFTDKIIDDNTTVYEQILRADGNVVKALERLNRQIRPSKVRVELNDKQTKLVFTLTDRSTNELIDGYTFKLIEKRNHKQFGNIITAYQLLNAAGYEIRRPLTQFDRAVLSVCISEWLEGNRFTTIPIIYRGLTGKVNRESDSKPTKIQRNIILDSIQILMSRTFISDPDAARKVLKYDDGRTTVINSALLPAWYAKNVTINGNDAETIIFFDRPCPLLGMAKAKKQIITYEAGLLDVPRQQNTPMNIELKNYCMLRVLESIAHSRQMRPIVTFNDVFEKCRLENSSRKTKFDARNILIDFFEHLKNKSVIDDFEVTKKAGAFYSIKFSYSKPK